MFGIAINIYYIHRIDGRLCNDSTALTVDAHSIANLFEPLHVPYSLPVMIVIALSGRRCRVQCKLSVRDQHDFTGLRDDCRVGRQHHGEG